MKINVPKQRSLPIVPFEINLLLCHCVTLSDWKFRLFDPFWRIYWMAQKGWHILYEGKSLALDPDHLVMIPPNTQCQSESRNPATQLYIHFTIGSIINFYTPGVFFIPLTQHTRSLITGIINSTIAGSETTPLVRTLRVKQLCYGGLAQLPKESHNASPYSPKITATLELMAKNIKNPLSNTDLAQAICMNTTAFVRFFHTETGESPQKWYMQKRINQAEILLSHTTRTIEDIAEETAFSDRNHFTHMFKKWRGVGPALYRRQTGRYAEHMTSSIL